MAEVGVSIQHDANHGAYLPRTWYSRLMGATLDMVSAPAAGPGPDQDLNTTLFAGPCPVCLELFTRLPCRLIGRPLSRPIWGATRLGLTGNAGRASGLGSKALKV